MSLETAVCAAGTIVWWASSVTFLLPFVLLLKFNKSIQHGWFSWIYSKLLASTFQPQQKPCRKRCFQMLKDHLGNRDTSVPLKILEIGIGGGGNLEFYPENSSLIALDMNPTFEKYFKEDKQKNPQVKLEKVVLSMAEDMSEIPDNSVDVVVSTYVLCSVEDVSAVLTEVQRILVPGGRFAFLEHVAFPEDQWGSTIQRLASPLFSIYCAGCNPHKKTDIEINKAGFSTVNFERKEQADMMLFVRPHITGIATK